MMAVGGLLGFELEAFAHLHADAARLEELDHLGVVLEVGAGRVAPRVAPAPVLLAEEPGQGGAVLVGEAELLADPAVPVLGQGLGHLDPEPVQEEVVPVLVLGVALAGRSSETRAPMVHHHEAGPVGLSGRDRSEEVG